MTADDWRTVAIILAAALAFVLFLLVILRSGYDHLLKTYRLDVALERAAADHWQKRATELTQSIYDAADSLDRAHTDIAGWEPASDTPLYDEAAANYAHWEASRDLTPQRLAEFLDGEGA